MPEWLNDNTVTAELSDQAFEDQVQKQMRDRVAKENKEGRPGNYGNDGLVVVYEEEKEIEGIKFQLKILRYFAVKRTADGFEIQKDRGMNKVGKHVVVESSTRPSYDLRDFLSLDEFLWQDTLHSWQNDMTVRRQWNEAEEMARDDINLIKNLPVTFKEKVVELEKSLSDWLESLKK
jgi:hypothetical protein